MKSDTTCTMRYIVAVAVLVFMTIDQTFALTTSYGNTNKNKEEKPTSPPVVVRGRECKTESDCNGISNTFCIKDYRDSKTRCLCVNKKPPSNGQCPKIPKPLKSICSNEHDCQEGAHCSPPINVTTNSASKTCMCKDGFMEEGHLCNSGYQSSMSSLITVLTACSLLHLTISAV